MSRCRRAQIGTVFCQCILISNYFLKCGSEVFVNFLTEASLTTGNAIPDLQQHRPGLQDDEDNQAQAETGDG